MSIYILAIPPMSSMKNIDFSIGFVSILGMFHHTMKCICKSEFTNKIKA